MPLETNAAETRAESLPTLALLRAAAEEARALLRVAALWPYDLEATIPVAHAGEDVAVLVHGALATAGTFRPLREELERAGVHTATFTYAPSFGVEEIAAGIRDLLQRLPGGVRIHLVGHSLGGLAVRWFVQEMGSDPRVVQTISLATPFEGARGAQLLPGPAGRDMKHKSPVLERLLASAARTGIPHLSILGTTDTAVSSETRFPVGDRLVIPYAGHNMLLFHADAVRAVRDRVVRRA
jgi:pimeloyl-ACP methyl ester carboxylesterase